MDQQFNSLVDLLQEHIRHHTRLKEILQLELEQDGRMTGGEILRLQREKYVLAQTIIDGERLRMSLLNKLALGWGLPGGEMTVSQLLPHLSDSDGQILLAAKQHLLDLVEELRDMAQRTAANALARKKAVDATLAVVNEAVKSHTTYSGEGRLHARVPSFKHTAV